jgi:signal transduction histidine kinase
LLNPSTLRGRLTLAYAGALVAALVAFAAIALAVVNSAQHRVLDGQLATTARALHLVGDVVHGQLVVDAKDHEQFTTIVGSKVEGAVVSNDGAIQVTSDRRDAEGLRAFAIAARSPQYGEVRVGRDSLRVYTEPVVADGAIVGHILTWHDADLIQELNRSVALAFTFAIPVVVALAIFAGSEIARRGLEPVQNIARLASEIEAKDLSRRLTLGDRSDELGHLGATFNRMLDRLQDAFDRERRFTSDASHELRAPLSVIRAEADLALRKERTPAEYRSALSTIASEADSLEELTRDLLAAARDGYESEEKTPVSVCETVESAGQRMGVLASARSVAVEYELCAPVYVYANRSMLERAIVSVLHNALKYTPQGGTVHMAVARENGRADVVVSDTGPGFSTDALAHGFERLWRDVENRAQEGSGLGLSLARSIVERYGGRIELANAQPHGAVVRMSFPAQPPGGASNS